jgi:heme/copper-type cytochrome/quinol oxidase subunit 2
VKKMMKRWMWILAGLAVVVIVVAAVVGGVVGSRAAQKNDGQRTQSTGNNTANTMTTTDPPTVTQTETAPSSATSTSTPNILARFYEFALDDCSGDSNTYNITSPGNMCYPVSSNKRSIFVSKNRYVWLPRSCLSMRSPNRTPPPL